MTDTPTRAGFRRPDRRAQRRQVDAAQPHGRGQGLDRHAQGADHAHPHSRRGDRRGGADRLRRHARPVPPAPPAGPGDGRRRLGRGRRCRCRRAADRGASRPDRGRAQAILERCASASPARTVALAINKIDKVKAEVLLALSAKLNAAYPFAQTFMISAERGHGVEDLRAGSPGPARGAVALPRRPDRRSAAAHDRRRDDARES
jgi:hypothetical protein